MQNAIRNSHNVAVVRKLYPSGHSIFIKRYIISEGDLFKTQLQTKLKVKRKGRKKNISFKIGVLKPSQQMKNKREAFPKSLSFILKRLLFGGGGGREEVTGEGAGAGRGAAQINGSPTNGRASHPA